MLADADIVVRLSGAMFKAVRISCGREPPNQHTVTAPRASNRFKNQSLPCTKLDTGRKQKGQAC
uniref:Uncharacterized protein n=1 Tax=Physcomitrium patens TaxID=3218 RepID=A0A2K1KUM6_PHYPA|nr:hypothetical protein PHYPA_004481 [Physcomitrium patens]